MSVVEITNANCDFISIKPDMNISKLRIFGFELDFEFIRERYF